MLGLTLGWLPLSFGFRSSCSESSVVLIVVGCWWKLLSTDCFYTKIKSPSTKPLVLDSTEVRGRAHSQCCCLFQTLAPEQKSDSVLIMLIGWGGTSCRSRAWSGKERKEHLKWELAPKKGGVYSLSPWLALMSIAYWRQCKIPHCSDLIQSLATIVPRRRRSRIWDWSVGLLPFA